MQHKKTFFGGFAAGFFFATIFFWTIGSIKNSSNNDDDINYLEEPISYEGKDEASFKVIQVLGDAALAEEENPHLKEIEIYNGNMVLILGSNFYTDQVVTIKDPMRVGTYSYTSAGGKPMTVPVLEQ